MGAPNPIDLLKIEDINEHWFKVTNIYDELSEPDKTMVEEMLSERADKNFGLARGYSVKLEDRAINGKIKKNVGAVYVACARIYMELGQSNQAEELLAKSSKCFPDDAYYRNVVRWMEGIACWTSGNQGKRLEAMLQWIECRDEFIELAKDSKYSGRIDFDLQRVHIDKFLKEIKNKIRN
jgi:hypothetical protein